MFYVKRMKVMNRIFISLMITLLLVGFSGCGQKKSTMHPLVVATPEYV